MTILNVTYDKQVCGEGFLLGTQIFQRRNFRWNQRKRGNRRGENKDENKQNKSSFFDATKILEKFEDYDFGEIEIDQVFLGDREGSSGFDTCLGYRIQDFQKQ